MHLSKVSFLALIRLAFCCLLGGFSSLYAQSELDLVPVAESNRWMLRNLYMEAPYDLSVDSVQVAGTQRRGKLRIGNPWTPYTLIVEPNPRKLLLVGIEGPGYSVLLDQAVDFFSLDRVVGSSWPSPLGTITFSGNNRKLQTPAGNYSGLAVFTVGGQAWFVKPGFGIVQIGESHSAFALSTHQVNHYTAPPPPIVITYGNCPLLGVDLSPSPGLPTTEEGRLGNMYAQGMRFSNIAVKWSEAEPQKGVFSLKRLEDWNAMASRTPVDLSLTLRIVDTNATWLPADLADRRLDDPVVLSRLSAFLTAVYSRMGNQFRYVNLSNEVDLFLHNHPGREAEFQTFLTAAVSIAKGLNSTRSVGLVFSNGLALPSESYVKRYEAQLDHVAFTYYPILSDFSPRPMTNVPIDFSQVARWTSRPIIFTEVGIPSSTTLGSSNEGQRAHLQKIFAELRKYSGRIRGAQVYQLSDLPDSVVQQLKILYASPDLDSNRFAAFLGSLGLFTNAGQAKPAYGELLTALSNSLASNACTVPTN